MDVKLWGFEELYEFYNCLTIYYLYSLRDILGMRRSGYRTGFMNCVGILYNFGVMGMVGEWCFGSEDSRCWILWLTCEWNAYPGIGSEHLFVKCKIPPITEE